MLLIKILVVLSRNIQHLLILHIILRTCTLTNSRKHLSYCKDSLFQVLFKRLTNFPSVTMMSTVHTTDPCNKAIVGTLVIYQLVKVVYVMTAPCAVAMAITNGTISTLKIVDTIFFAISVLALPKRYRVAFQERAKNIS